jgi:nitrogen PTS system EIIA component
MPYRTFGPSDVARYLHLTTADVEQLVQDQVIPFERHGQKVVFRKVDIDAWASQRILGLEGRRLSDYHLKTTPGNESPQAAAGMLGSMLQPGFIDPALPAKTKASVLREMARLAARTGHVCDPKALLAGLEAREQLCSTGVPGGLALLHTRNHEEYLFDSAFLTLGRTVQQIPFGSPDGRPTDLFFLIASTDERLHLHILARICLMAQKTDLLAELRAAPDAHAMHDCLLAAEQAVGVAPRG